MIFSRLRFFENQLWGVKFGALLRLYPESQREFPAPLREGLLQWSEVPQVNSSFYGEKISKLSLKKNYFFFYASDS